MHATVSLRLFERRRSGMHLRPATHPALPGPPQRRHCGLDAAGEQLLQLAVERLGMSARAYDRILKVARTVADLAGVSAIGAGHVSEAIQYRSLDRSWWRG
jgi:magnesium chelatase family protein